MYLFGCTPNKKDRFSVSKYIQYRPGVDFPKGQFGAAQIALISEVSANESTSQVG